MICDLPPQFAHGIIRRSNRWTERGTPQNRPPSLRQTHCAPSAGSSINNPTLATLMGIVHKGYKPT